MAYERLAEFDSHATVVGEVTGVRSGIYADPSG